ncbi:hypothetical protein ACFCYX_17880 [Streptomyces populi]|uniref:hypothetical protein n=1 Tax=Streptomyces populi TaxID=2058924 RepID=UPI0019D28753|nr:hypothetical protein [Streptomyces populi]
MGVLTGCFRAPNAAAVAQSLEETDGGSPLHAEAPVLDGVGAERVDPVVVLGRLVAAIRRTEWRVGLAAANIQDRDGAKRSLLWIRLDHPGVQKIRADQGFAGRLVEWTSTVLGREPEIVRKAPGRRGSQVQSKRWAVERTLSGITSHQRPARDYETGPARSETMIRWAMIGIMVRRLARGRPASRPGPRPLSSKPGL